MADLVAKVTPIEGAKNISVCVEEGRVLYVVCDLSKDFGASSSGKSYIVGTTSGNKPLGNSGAFLGVNIFTKDLAKRSLQPEAVAALRQDDFQACGEGCQWRIAADGVTLLVRVDFGAVTEREASSGKTVLLATSGSFKPVAKTGISFNLNCYRQKDAAFDGSKIAEAGATGPRLRAGDAAVLTDNGYTVEYRSATEAVVSFAGNAGTLNETATLKDCKLDDVTVAFYVSPPKAKRAKTEGAGAAPGAATGGLLDTPAEKVRNARVSCTNRQASDDFTLTLAFDPTQSFGRSGSGKSLTVGTTAGFQAVAGPDGVALCRLQFNAYRPAPPIGEADVVQAVASVLGQRSSQELGGLTFKSVLADVGAALGASEAQLTGLKDSIKAAVKDHLGRALPSQSQ